MALMEGEKDSGDESKDSKDAYCEEVCTEPYMQCMSLMEQGKLDGDGNGGKCPRGMFDTERTCEKLGEWCDDESADDDGCISCSHCDESDRRQKKCPECMMQGGGENKGPVECDEDENFKVMMKGKDGKMMAKCCPAANTLWDWSDMENPKALQCCRTPITMDNKC